MRGRGGREHQPAGSRGQTETIGVVLVLALTLIGATVALAFGATALNDARVNSQEGGIEHAMTQLDSRSAMVALGDSSSQRIRMASTASGGYNADPDAGRIIITHHDYDGTGNDTEIYNETLGALVYERGDTLIAYQGGGVWRSQGANSTMVSPPEFHYQSATLTLPVIRLEGSASAAGSGITAKVTRETSAVRIYPSDTTYPSGEPYKNPVREGNATVTIESDYYQAWATYFRTRTSGEVTVDPANETVSVKLISLGTTGAFKMPADGNSIELRGLEDGHPITDFNITIRPDDSDSADFSNLQWSLYADEGSQEFEIHLRAQGKNDDASTADCTARNVSATVYYSDKNGDPYHGWYEKNAYVTTCEDVDGDGENETYLEADLVGPSQLTMESLSSSEIQHFSPSGNKLVDKANFTEHAGEENAEWEPEEFVDGNRTSIGNLTNHYLSLMGPDVELIVEDKGSDTVNEDTSSGEFEQTGGEGRFITFLHITENRVRIEFE